MLGCSLTTDLDQRSMRSAWRIPGAFSLLTSSTWRCHILVHGALQKLFLFSVFCIGRLPIRIKLYLLFSHTPQCSAIFVAFSAS
jgi:hypothetical protein